MYASISFFGLQCRAQRRHVSQHVGHSSSDSLHRRWQSRPGGLWNTLRVHIHINTWDGSHQWRYVLESVGWVGVDITILRGFHYRSDSSLYYPLSLTFVDNRREACQQDCSSASAIRAPSSEDMDKTVSSCGDGENRWYGNAHWKSSSTAASRYRCFSNCVWSVVIDNIWSLGWLLLIEEQNAN